MVKGVKLPTLLVVTENPSVRAWIKKNLEEPFFLLYASTESEAIGALNSKVDFILIDEAMELLDPLKLCQRLRQEEKLAPIFLITGKLKQSFRKRAQQAGVSEFLSDQLDDDELISRIKEGEKGAQTREKTADLSFALKSLPQSGSSLKDKIVLNDQGMKVLKQAQQAQVPLSLLLLQIDHFDTWVNKEEVFSSLGTFIEKLLREKDVLIPSSEGRYFLLLFNTAQEPAKKVAEKLKEKISFHPFSALQPLTVSIAVFPLEEQGLQNTINAAIKSLRTQPNRTEDL